MQTQIENIPAELKALPCWVCWQGQNKIPKNPFNGRNAQSNNRKTWGTFEQAVKACDTFGLDGLGFMFDESLDYFGVDLDHCIDNVDFVDEFVETLESYAEISKSGTGIHIICKGKLPEGANRKNNVEMYSNGRYFIVTGNVYNQKYKEIKDCTETIKVLHNKYLPSETPKAEIRQTVTVELDDSEVIEKARNCKTGTLFSMLYSGQWEGLFPSQSEADLAFCNQLAFWTGKDEQQMDRIFRNSGLFRPKWDKKHGRDTYGNITIEKACASCNEVYEPKKNGDTSLAMSFFGKKTSNDIQTNENDNMQADEQEYQEVIELAKKNVLDKAVFEFANRFNDLSDFDAFYAEIMPFAEFQRKKIDFKNEMKEKRKSIEDRERLEKRAKRQHGLPDWIYFDKNDTVKINETKYIEYFVESYPLKYTNDTFFDYFGKKKDGEILQVIHSDIKNYIVSNLARTANNLFNALKNAVYCNEFIPDMKQIHFRNGILSADKDGLFTIWESDRQEIYINNLSCTYNQKASLPKKFLSFLRELLFDDDIVTLHEWLGYLLLPTNKLQLSLYLQGSGGEGKSVIGNILKELFGIKNIFSGRIEDFDTNRFSTSELESKLLFLDDDVSNGALKNSGKFKTIISNGGKCFVEKKGQQQHSIDLYSRFLLFGNYPLISLFDNSNGFYRRFHYVRVKPKAKNRNDILDIEHTFLDEEKEGIVKWLVDGLNELIQRNWSLYISERSKTVSDELKFQNDTIRIFLDSGFDENSNIILGANNRVPVAVLYDTYLDFCRENGLDTVGKSGFSNRIQSMQNEYNLRFSTNIPTCDKNGVYKRVRGFWGIGVKTISVPNTNYENNTIHG